jgi:hypothetical protein
MRVGIVGSRNYNPLAAVREFVERLPYRQTIVSGGARGVDRAAEDAAKVCGHDLVSFRVGGGRNTGADFYIYRYSRTGGGDYDGWEGYDDVRTLVGGFRSYGAAAYMRNRYIVEFSEVVVPFWDGHSRGTANSMELAAAAGKLAAPRGFFECHGLNPYCGGDGQCDYHSDALL